MRAVLLSIQPKYCELIANGKKTIEVRKTRPEIDTPFKCYIYCSYGNIKENYCLGKKGKVIGEFTCDKIDGGYEYGKGRPLYGWHITDLKIYSKPKELSEFKKAGFLTEEDWLFKLYPNTHCHYEAWAKKFVIERPPQSWCYVESLGE